MSPATSYTQRSEFSSRDMGVNKMEAPIPMKLPILGQGDHVCHCSLPMLSRSPPTSVAFLLD